MIQVEFHSFIHAQLPCSLQRLKKVVELTSQADRRLHGVVSIFLVGTQRIRKLNQKFRKKDKVTDVLSFSFSEEHFFPSPLNEEVCGDIFLCPQYIQRQARRHKVPFKNEFLRMLIHGLLHLAGHDHVDQSSAQIMFTLQENILSKAYQKIFNQKSIPYPVDVLVGREVSYLA